MIGQEPRAHVRCGKFLLSTTGKHVWLPGIRADDANPVGWRHRIGCWPVAEAEKLTHGRKRPFGLARHAIAIEDARVCGCCGRHSYEVELRLELDHADPARREWRCERHRLRSPCAIDGCRKTFALAYGESPAVRVICGRHWRMAPKYMRDRFARLTKKGKRLEWPDRIAELHGKAWEAVYRAVTHRLDGGSVGLDTILKEIGL